MYNKKTEKSLFCGAFAAEQQRVQHKILTSEYTYFSFSRRKNGTVLLISAKIKIRH